MIIILSFLLLSANGVESVWQQEVLMDNERVLMVRNTFPPGTESGPHQHAYPVRTVYVVAGGELLLQPLNSEQPERTIIIETGSALMLPAQAHNIKNVGQSTVVLIETELK
ncbi:cupin domain-containing protein [Marinicella meishanensis]|uniref:cupin domain-containing protein n=1 Tax=Marinicella meishanensis TaxID=2873263 RepID=UPI001CBBFF8E|nr:cupin domain-containing protein [Marinicella sp. NBU2979]